MMIDLWWTKVKLCIINLALLSSCILGDKLLQANVQLLTSYGRRAVFDNLIHGIIGFLSWCVVTSSTEILECLLCGFLACLIDIDHFIAARSFKLKDALNLSSRPPFHNTLLLSIPFISFLSVNVFIKSAKLHRFSFLYITAVISHHVRDGYRRGINLNPLPNIPQFQYWIYILIIIVFPHLIKLFLKQEQRSFSYMETERNIA